MLAFFTTINCLSKLCKHLRTLFSKGKTKGWNVLRIDVIWQMFIQQILYKDQSQFRNPSQALKVFRKLTSLIKQYEPSQYHPLLPGLWTGECEYTFSNTIKSFKLKANIKNN